MSQTIQPADRREWWPADYMDEFMPAGRETPDAWLCTSDTGAHAYGIPGDSNSFYHPKPLFEGEIVAFVAGDDLGTARLVIADDGSFTCTPLPPTAASYVHLDDDAAMGGDTVADLVGYLREYGELETEHVLRFQASSGQVRCRFTALDGPPRFVPLDPIPDGPADAVTAPAEDEFADLFRAPVEA